MLRSLWFRLAGAFMMVIAVMVLVIVFTVNLATQRALNRYLIRNGEIWAQNFVPILAEQYQYYGDWEFAQLIVVNPWRMMGMGRHGSQWGNSDMWGQMGLRVVIADRQGEVVADSGNSLLGERLSPNVLQRGIPIMVDGQQVGTLLLINPQRYAPLQQSFLSAVNRSVLLAGLVAGVAALLVGTLLFVAIMRPLRRLQEAAGQVAAGDLSARVPVTGRDELGTLAEAFNQMAAGLEQQQRLRQQMVADIAHELRTPISIIQGSLEAMLDGVLKPEPAELREVYAETRRLARLVEDLRMLSLADAGQLTLARGPVDLAETVERVVGRMTPLAEARQISLRAAVTHPVPPIEADADRLAQVLTNLIDNALRYTPAGGHVTVSLDQEDGRLKLAVADDGPGIPQEELPFIFERFWRGDRSRSRHSGGSGIGLAIVKQLVELHGGAVEVTSQVGKGSTFVVSLPLSAPSQGQAGQRQVPTPPHTPTA